MAQLLKQALRHTHNLNMSSVRSSSKDNKRYNINKHVYDTMCYEHNINVIIKITHTMYNNLHTYTRHKTNYEVNSDSICMCIGVYIYICYIYIHTYTCVCIYIYMWTPNKQAPLEVQLLGQRKGRSHIYIYMYMCIYIYIYV